MTEFATGEAETASLALIVDNGSSPLKVCSVSLAPKATTTTLAAVLNAAVAGTTPAACVTGFLPASGEGAITQVNGFPAAPAEKWNVTIDGGTKSQAKRNTDDPRRRHDLPEVRIAPTSGRRSRAAARAARPRGRLDCAAQRGSVDGEAGERPARARHCDREKPVARPRGSHWPRGREGAAGSSEARRPPSDP